MSQVLLAPGLIRSRPILDRVLVSRGLRPTQEVQNFRWGAALVERGWRFSLPGWSRPVVVDVSSGRSLFDNDSSYGPTHPDVISGKKRVGDDGSSGDVSRYYDIIDEVMAEELKESMTVSGMSVVELPSGEGRVLEVSLTE